MSSEYPEPVLDVHVTAYADDRRCWSAGRAAVLVWLALIALGLSGCVEGRQSNHELEHVTPAHWPTGLADAANKLDQRLPQLDNQSTAEEVKEILEWIPEVAADGPLPENRWNEVRSHCEKLTTMANKSPVASSDYQHAITELCQQLRSLDAEFPKPVFVVPEDASQTTSPTE